MSPARKTTLCGPLCNSAWSIQSKGMGHAWVIEDGYMVSFATSKYNGSRLDYRGWVYDFICNLSIIRVTPGYPRWVHCIWYHFQPLNIKDHAWVTEDGYMISFSTIQYKGSRLDYRGWVNDIICNLSILKITPRLPRKGIWNHLQPLNIKGHTWITEDTCSYMISFAASQY